MIVNLWKLLVRNKSLGKGKKFAMQTFGVIISFLFNIILRKHFVLVFKLIRN